MADRSTESLGISKIPVNRTLVEKVGTVGAVLAALACPICFPKLALIGAAVGLAVFAPFERYIAIAIQALFILALIGQALAYPRHGNVWLLSLSVVTTALLFAAYYLFPSSILIQLSLVGWVAASIWLFFEVKRCAKCEATSDRANADA